ncbi:DNA polymerase III alpha [Serratia phage vB_SmaM_Hera]|uniref:DNA polymerase III alpha n=1 Tax=Serratia phage vB_SmaM_Hera TaxID=2777369 RepID=A0A7T3N974_9CAUD|nr:DNA polymerase III alpha [Serratia phage vB_SmaM_Hera]
MEGFPQLRVRTGYTFKRVYGRTPEVVAKLKELGCQSAAIVDDNTWGAVRWAKDMEKAGLSAIFGMEVKIKSDDLMSDFYRVAWILAKDSKKFFNATSKAAKQGFLTPEEFGALEGVVRFAGAAVGILAPEQYDYIDVNPSSRLLAAHQVDAARRTGKPVVITSYNDMPGDEHKNFAYAYRIRDRAGIRRICTLEDLESELGGLFEKHEWKKAIDNTYAVAECLKGVKLQKAPIIHLDGDMVALARQGKEYRVKMGHIKEWTQEYEDRFVEEIHQIQLKDFDSYFLVVADLVRFAKTKMLVGPARGSSAGSLVCYCLGITEVDPLPFHLLFQRFIDISRADLPDIDIDFEDTKRHLVFEYLQEKYGVDNVSKLGNINTLKAASVMAEVGKKFSIDAWQTDAVKNSLIEYSSGDARYGKGLQDTFSTTGPGQEFVAKYPAAAACMGDLELHPSHTGVHAAGILVCNEPITDYCTVGADGVPHIDKPDSEYLNLLKIDALGLRTLGIIGDTGVITAEELYSLKFDDEAVFSILNDDKVSGIFQFEGDAVRSVTRSVHIDRFSKIDNLTALARPGPLASGMAQKYIARAKGEEPVTYDVPQLEKYLKDTYGVFLYQEQIMSVVKEIGLFDWVKTSAVRKAMSGRKGEEYFNQMGEDFVAGATSQGVPEEQAKKIWQEMVTFGSWGFNKSHSVAYAIITYYTIWLKYYYPLQFAAACLRAAKDDEQTIAILRELVSEGIDYVPIDTELSQANWTVADGKLIGGIMNAKGFGLITANKYIAARENGTLTDKMREKLAKAEVQFADLREAHTKWGHYYNDPTLIGVTTGHPIINMADVPDRHNGLIIGKLVKKVLASELEAIRVKKRVAKGKPAGWKGQHQFVDLFLVDDSTDSPMRFRIPTKLYDQVGKRIFEGSPKGAWFLVRGYKIPGLGMFNIDRIKRIDIKPQAEKTLAEIEAESEAAAND